MKVMVIKIETYHKTNILTKKAYLMNIIIDLKNSDTWKIQLTTAINFISPKYAEKKRVMNTMSDNIKFTLIMMQMKLLINSLIHFVQDMKEVEKHQ